MATKITDLIDEKEIVKLQELDSSLQKALITYCQVAKEMAKGLQINVTNIGDLEKLENFFVDKSKEATEAQSKLNGIIKEQNQILTNTTNTISRHLMEQERVNKTQRDAYTEYDRVKKLLDQYHDTYDGQLTRLAQLNDQLKANNKAQKDNEKALSGGRIAMTEYQAKQKELIAQHRSLTQEKRTLSQLMTAEEKASQSQEGSYTHMSQQLELLKKAYKDLNQESRETDFGKELEASIQNLDAHLKDMAADMGEFQRNVGNYAIANSDLKKKYNDLIGTLAALQTQYEKMSEAERAAESGQKLADGINEISAAAKEIKQTLDEQTKAVEAARQSLEGMSEPTSSVKRDLKELVLEIANLTIEYQNLSEEEKASAEGQALADHIRDLTEKAGVLKDAIADTNAAIANAASDTRAFDQLGGSIQLAIDGFGLAQGAAAMLGISEQELAEIQTKLQAAIAASNAMQSIQNSLQAQSAVMQGANLIQTRLRTAAENLHTAAQGRGVIVTKAATAAQWAFNAAANANPIGLVVVVIVACIAAVWGLVKAFSAFFSVSGEAVEKYKQQKQGLEDLCNANDKLIDRMKARGATEVELLNQSLQNKQAEKKAAEALFARACELYDEDEDEYKEALDSKKKADDDYEKYKEDSLNYLQKIQSDVNAKVREEEIGTLAYKIEVLEREKKEQLKLANILFETGKLTRQMYEDIVNSVNKAAELKINDLNEKESEKAAKSHQSAVSAAQQAAAELQKAVQAGEDALLKIISDSLERQRQAEILSYNRQLSKLQEQLAKTTEKEVTLRTALNNQIEGLTAEHNSKMEELQMSQNERYNKAEAEFISSHLAIVKAGSEEELEWRLKELSNHYQAELLAIQKSERNKTITMEQAEEMRVNLAIKYADLREKAESDHAGKVAESIEKRYAAERTNQDNAYVYAMNSLKHRYAEELAAAKGNAAQQEAIKAKFEQDQARLSEKYAQHAAETTISMLEEILKNEKLSAEERLKYEQALAKAKTDLETLMADASIAQIERITEADNKAGERRRANAQQWLQVASDSLNAINDLVGSVYDARISKIEEEQEVNSAAGEAEIERITQLVDRKVITEEEGEARKRAAEAKTAKNNEELEKKKQQLKHKQAVWDKANSVAQAGIATALAIVQALPNMVLAAIAGAMGAVQIATIVATPIPKYAKGTDRHKGGPAIVGDGGLPELVVFGNESWITPDSPTLVDLPEGAQVIPMIEKVVSLPANDGAGDNAPKVVVNNDNRRLEEKVDTLIYMLKKQINQQRRIADDAYIQSLIDKL